MKLNQDMNINTPSFFSISDVCVIGIKYNLYLCIGFMDTKTFKLNRHTNSERIQPVWIFKFFNENVTFVMYPVTELKVYCFIKFSKYFSII